MKIEIFWGVITLIGVIMAIKYRVPFRKFVGPMIIGFTGCLWVAYIFG